MARQCRLDQRVRFLIAGGFASGVSWLSRFLFSTVLSYTAAVAAATATGMVIGFVTYRSFVFPKSRQSLAAQLAGFVLVNLAGATVTLAVALVVRELLVAGSSTVADPAAHAFGIAVGAVANYFGHKTVTFRTT
jgi:energy-coupling factor transport system substrate-specific component